MDFHVLALFPRELSEHDHPDPQSIYCIDLAKHFLCIHGEDKQGKELIHKLITRSKVLSNFASIPRVIVEIEAGGASHSWARERAKLNHTALEIPPILTPSLMVIAP